MMSDHSNEKNHDTEIKNVNNILTPQDVQNVARKIFNESSKEVVSFSLNPYSKEKLGFTASHQLLQITVKKKNTQCLETINLFVKSVAYDCKDQEDLAADSGILDEEFEFFGKIAPLLYNYHKGEKWSPLCYLVKNNAMVMEDLRSSGFKLRGRLFDETILIKSALAALARLHSCTIVAEAHLKQLSGKTTTLQDQYPNNFKEKIFFEHDGGVIGQWLSSGVDVVAVVAEKLGANSQKLRDAFHDVKKIAKPSQKYRNVICHGDLWTNNMMFDDTLPIPKCVLVDYQCLRYAPLVLDILHFLYVNTTRAYREKHERELIEFYHGVLVKSVELSDATKSANVPCLEETLKAYSDSRLFGICLATLYFPFILVDSKVMNEKIEYEGFNNVLFGNRSEFTLDYMDKDGFFKLRVEEAVMELVDFTQSL